MGELGSWIECILYISTLIFLFFCSFNNNRNLCNTKSNCCWSIMIIMKCNNDYFFLLFYGLRKNSKKFCLTMIFFGFFSFFKHPFIINKVVIMQGKGKMTTKIYFFVGKVKFFMTNSSCQRCLQKFSLDFSLCLHLQVQLLLPGWHPPLRFLGCCHCQVCL